MKNKFITALAAALALAALLLGAACSSGESTTTTLAPTVGQMVTLPSGLQYTVLVAGTGAVALPGHQVTVNYTGKLTNGNTFDSSIGRAPFAFMLGSGQVILGWDIGVAGMKVGEKRQLIIPASLGYGSTGTAGIPPNSVLIFDVDLLEVK